MNIEAYTLENANKVKKFVSGQTQEFTTLSICDLMDYFEVVENKNWMEFTWEQECELVKDFCKKHNLYLYERYREDFNQHEGIALAKQKGCKGVIFSDLS